MDRLHALAPTNEELMSLVYNEGTLPQEEREHLEHCPICQQRLATYTRTTELLRTKLYRSLCPSAVDLNYYCLGGLPEKERIGIASHLLDCPLCAEEVEEIRREQASFDLYPAAAFSLPAAVRRIFATLVVQQAQPVLRDDLRAHVAAGVTMIRSPGLAGEPPAWFGVDDDVPRAVHGPAETELSCPASAVPIFGPLLPR